MLQITIDYLNEHAKSTFVDESINSGNRDGEFILVFNNMVNRMVVVDSLFDDIVKFTKFIGR
jgi:hypothetical protein